MGKRLIIHLGGYFLKDEAAPKGYRTGTFNDPGLPGDFIRSTAAALFYHQRPDNTTVLVIGGRWSDWPMSPTLSELIMDELAKLKVPTINIKEIPMLEQGGTHNQLLATESWLHQWAHLKELKQVVIISNHYHIARIMTLIRNAPRLGLESFLCQGLLSGLVKVTAAEDLILDLQPEAEWPDLFKRAYGSSEMLKRQIGELRGATQILNGSYNYPQPFYPDSAT